MKARFFLVCTIVFAAVAVAQTPLTNAAIVDLVKHHFSPETIILEIKHAPVVDFRVEPADLYNLRREKVPESVIRAMIDRAGPSSSVPVLTWALVPQDSRYGCLSNGRPVGASIDCHSFNTCGNDAGNLIMCRGEYYAQAIQAEPGNATLPIPTITWNIKAQGARFQCVANGQDVGTPLDCGSYWICGSGEAEKFACAGAYYEPALKRIWGEPHKD